PVFVGEPSLPDTVAILRGLKEKYEVHHGIRIRDGALVAAARLSSRYITDRFLPDKAIDLIDEAASQLKMEIDSVPTPIDQLQRKIVSLEIEKQALAKEKDKSAVERRDAIESELSELREKSSGMKARWQAEKGKLADAQKLKEQLDQARGELDQAQRNGNLGRAGEIAYGIIPDLTRRLKEAETAAEHRMLNEVVTEQDVAGVVSRWTGIPVDKMLEGERDKLLRMEEAIMKRVVGQSEAVTAVSTEGAGWLVDHGIRLVGTDFISIETQDDPTFPVHRALLGAGIAIVEGLDLRDVSAGRYTLWCLPLKIHEGDGGPARVVLVAD
ncbi:MAG: hypothetical protein ACXVQT_07290, partial [Actinomycetota bacterium]